MHRRVAESDEPVGDDRTTGAVAAQRELLVDPPGSDPGQPVGLLGDPAGLPGRHLQGLNAFPQQREAVAQVEGVALFVAYLVFAIIVLPAGVLWAVTTGAPLFPPIPPPPKTTAVMGSARMAQPRITATTGLT